MPNAIKSCPACAGQDLLGPIPTTASGYDTRFQLEEGWLADTFDVTLLSVVCGDCGYVSTFAPPEAVQKLRERAKA